MNFLSINLITPIPDVTIIIISETFPVSATLPSETFFWSEEETAEFYDSLKHSLTLGAHGTLSKLTHIVIDESEIRDVIEGEAICKVLQEKGIRMSEIENIKLELLNYIKEKAEERGIRLTKQVEEALANLIVLIAKKIDQET